MQIGICTEPSQLGNAVRPRLAGWDEQTAPPRWGRARQSKPVHLPESWRDLIFKPAEETSTAKPEESHGGGASGKNTTTDGPVPPACCVPQPVAAGAF